SPNVGRKVTADSNGFYTFSNLAGGNYAVRVRAAGYDVLDARTSITSGNATLNLVLTKTITTTTSVPVLHADFSISPIPCTMTPGGTSCNVDGSLSSSAIGISTYMWSYLGITASSIVHSLVLSCGDGPEREVHIPVTLTIFETTSGLTDTITKSV